MKTMTRLVAFLLLLAVTGAVGAQTRAWLDRDRVALGESATLNIETDASAAPDYAPLLQDFDLSGQSSRQQLSWINGNVSARSLYAVALRPRHDGLLRIPPLRVGARVTAPLTLLVTAAPADAVSGSGDVFIQSEADAQDPYVQQTVGWVVRLYSAVPLIAGQLDQPEPAGATLQRIGDDVQYRRVVGSRSYVVTERRYLLIPERSGELVIPPARFEGRGTGNAFDQMFGDGQTALHAVARPRVLRVRPIPAGAPQPWLPLRALSMRYVGQPAKAQVGRAFDIVVEVTADGATASQLPDIALPAVDGAQVFPERAQPDESMLDGRPQVRLQRRFSVVPARPGRLVLPGPSVDWWDSRAGAARTTALPPVTLQVAPGSLPAGGTSEPVDTGARAVPRRAPLPWMLGVVGGVALVLIGAGLAWRRRSLAVDRARRRPAAAAAPPAYPPPFPGATPPPNATVASPPVPPPVPDALPSQIADAEPSAPHRGTKTVQGDDLGTTPTPSLARVLELGDLADIDAALRRLAGDSASDLDAVIARLDDPAQRDAVEQLRVARWAGGDAGRARSRLRETFAAGPRWRTPSPPRDERLPPLYPER